MTPDWSSIIPGIIGGLLWVALIAFLVMMGAYPYPRSWWF